MFKIGDKVERVNVKQGQWDVGDRDVITEVFSQERIRLSRDTSFTHSGENLKLIDRKIPSEIEYLDRFKHNFKEGV